MQPVPCLESMLDARTVWRGQRDVPSILGESTGYVSLDAVLPQRGWPTGALTELLHAADGLGELACVLPTLVRMTQAQQVVVVIAPPYVPYAPAWQEAGIDLRYLEIVQAGERDALWAFEQCLRSGACSAVLGWPRQADAPALRRLQVAADTGRALAFAYRDHRHLSHPSPAALRLECDGQQVWVRKSRGAHVPPNPIPLTQLH